MDKAVITAAITGAVHFPTLSPYLPITPQQISAEAVRAYEAGAAIAHIHVRDTETGIPSSDLGLYREVAISIKSKCNMIICFTTGAGLGMTTEERVAVVPTFKPELASLNFGSMNFSMFPLAEKIKEFKFPWEKQRVLGSEDYIFPNTFKTLREFLGVFAKNDTKPELEIYDLGMINNVAFMIRQGYLKKPVHIQFVMGVLGGVPATTSTLVTLHNAARETIGDFTWSVCASGYHQIPICTAALTMGGNARVGMEDSLFVSKGVLAKSNAEQVGKIARIARELSLEPATPDEARQILGLKGSDKVNW
jgi:uncharacterized protein (DUF849 family)